MIKLTGTKKKGYVLDCPPNWLVAVTYSELMAILKLLRKHFSLEELNHYRKQAAQPLVKKLKPKIK